MKPCHVSRADLHVGDCCIFPFKVVLSELRSATSTLGNEHILVSSETSGPLGNVVPGRLCRSDFIRWRGGEEPVVPVGAALLTGVRCSPSALNVRNWSSGTPELLAGGPGSDDKGGFHLL